MVSQAGEQLLQKTELFVRLLPDDFQCVCSLSEELTLPPGVTLFSPGETATRFYILIRGTVRVFKRKEGREEELALFTAGDTVGDFDFARQGRYDAFAETLEETDLVCFPAARFSLADITRQYPSTMARVLLQSLAMIANRIRTTQRLISRNVPWVQELQRQAFEDPGTGLWNRTFFEEELPQMLSMPVGLIMTKPDRFKVLVDSCGHSAGDEAMVKIAALLQYLVRNYGKGWALRLKSNETALVLPGCSPATLRSIAEELYQRFLQLPPVLLPDGSTFTFSATVVYGVWGEERKDSPALWKEYAQTVYDTLMNHWQEGGNGVYPAFPC
ncbi:MAG: diguanylate cyclase [Treponemataceae bacterium]|nr:diguanylate cyclase [Treponemataceae bacterium]